MTKNLTQESVVCFLNLCRQEELAQRKQQTVTGCWNKARGELRGLAYHQLERPLHTMFKKWHERASKTGPMSLIVETRTATWKTILALANETLEWSDDPWHPYTVIQSTKEGYGLHRSRSLNGEPVGWIIKPGEMQATTPG